MKFKYNACLVFNDTRRFFKNYMIKPRYTCRIVLLKMQNYTLFSAILPELLDNFENVSVEVVQCPDLTQPPFNLTSEGT